MAFVAPTRNDQGDEVWLIVHTSFLDLFCFLPETILMRTLGCLFDCESPREAWDDFRVANYMYWRTLLDCLLHCQH